MSSTYGPGGSAGKRSCPFSFVVSVAGPPISAGELTRTTAPGRTPPWASLTVPMRAPVSPCAAVILASRTQAAAPNSKEVRVLDIDVSPLSLLANVDRPSRRRGTATPPISSSLPNPADLSLGESPGIRQVFSQVASVTTSCLFISTAYRAAPRRTPGPPRARWRGSRARRRRASTRRRPPGAGRGRCRSSSRLWGGTRSSRCRTG